MDEFQLYLPEKSNWYQIILNCSLDLYVQHNFEAGRPHQNSILLDRTWPKNKIILREQLEMIDS